MESEDIKNKKNCKPQRKWYCYVNYVVKLVVLIIILFSFCSKLFAKDKHVVKFKHLQISNGLSSNVSNCVVQDKSGFIWVGTESGLNRFDGYNVKRFNHNRDENSISNNVIKCLFVDSKGLLWIGTDYGLNVYNYKTERFTNIYSESSLSGLSSNSVLSIVEDNELNIWIGTSNGLNRCSYDSYTEKYSMQAFYNNKNDSKSLSENRVYSLFFDREYNLWIGTLGGGLCMLSAKNISNRQFIFERYNASLNSLSDDYIFAICQTDNGAICVGNTRGVDLLVRYDDGFVVKPLDIYLKRKPATVLSLVKDDVGNIWIASFGNGLIKYNPLNNDITRFTSNIYDLHSISRNYLSNLYFAKDGHLWITARETGVDYVNTKQQRFYQISKFQDSWKDRVVKTVVEDEEGYIVFGCYSAPLYKFHPKTGVTSEYFDHNTGITNIESVCRDNNNNIWIGSKKGVIKYSKRNNRFTYFNTKNSEISNNDIWDVYDDSFRNCIWVATKDGLNSIDKSTFKITRIFSKTENSQSLSYNYVRKSFVDSKNNLWVCTFGGGVNLLSDVNEPVNSDMKFTIFKHSHQKYNSISSNFVNTIFEDSNNRIWLGTQNGINLFNPDDKSFEYYTANNGLAGNIVKGILEDNDGKLWITTQKGLSKFDPISKTFSNFYARDGLQGDIFNLNACYKSSDSKLYLGGKNGITYFDPNQIKDLQFEFTPYLSSFIADNIKIKPGEIHHNTEIIKESVLIGSDITLPADYSSFTISFASINFGNLEKAHYLYKLEGVDKKFNEISEYNHMVSYSNLIPGDYVFVLTDSNKIRVRSIKIKLLPPFWRSQTALYLYLLIFFIFLLLSYFLLKRKMQKRKFKLIELERQKNLEEMTEFKFRFFTNVSHEFRTPLTLISGPVQKLTNDESQLSKTQKSYYYNIINHNVNILLNLVNQLLDFRKLNNKDKILNVQRSNIIELLSLYEQTFSHYCERKNISLIFNKKSEQFNVYIDTLRFERIIYNLLSNAVKYSNIGDNIEINLYTDVFDLPKSVYPNISTTVLKDYMCIAVSDSGDGIPADKLDYIFERFTTLKNPKHDGDSSGIGLSFSREIARKHKGDITVDSVVGQGATFYLWLPADSSYYSKAEKVETQRVDSLASEIEDFIIIDKNSPECEIVEVDSNDKKSILIVDDYKELRHFIRNILQNEYNIFEAENGQEAFALALKHGPDLIVSDVMMPVMDGISFCKKVKQNISISHTPIIMLTAKSSNEHEIEGLETGADAYVKKPFNPKYLTVIIKNILSNRKLSHDFFDKGVVPKEEHLKIANKEEKLIEKINKTIIDNIDNNKFSVTFLAEELGLSTVHLYRKLKSLTGMSTNEYISKQKLKYAAALLKQGSLRIAEVAYMSGYSDPKYFRICFKKEFGCSPSDYR